MKESITYKIAGDKDYPAILLLYNKMYKTNRSLAEFRWLTEDNPAGRATLFVATLNKKVVGMQSLIPYIFIRDGEQIITMKSEDTLVEKNLRGKGIFSKLYDMVHEHAGDTLVWGLTDKKEILERVNMPSSERLTISVSVNRPSFIPDKKGIHRFVAKTLFYSFLYLKSSFRSKKVSTNLAQAEIAPSNFGSNELQDFFAVLSKQNPSILFPVMKKDYLNWRLTKNPNLDTYRIFVSYHLDHSIAICSIVGISGKAAYWESFYALNDVSIDEKVGHIVSIKKQIFKSGVNLFHTWLFECNPEVKKTKEIFLQSGFSKVRDGLWIVHNSSAKEINAHNLYFSPQLGIR